jgi:hypothetical protein
MLKKLIFIALVFCIAISCISCTTAESKEIASNMVGKTFKGKVEFDYASDWDVTWEFGEETVKVTKEYSDFKGIPVIEEKEFKYKVTGTYKKAMAEFPDTNAWHDVRIFFDAKGEIYYIEHIDSVGTTRFYVAK